MLRVPKDGVFGTHPAGEVRTYPVYISIKRRLRGIRLISPAPGSSGTVRAIVTTDNPNFTDPTDIPTEIDFMNVQVDTGDVDVDGESLLQLGYLGEDGAGVGPDDFDGSSIIYVVVVNQSDQPLTGSRLIFDLSG